MPTPRIVRTRLLVRGALVVLVVLVAHAISPSFAASATASRRDASLPGCPLVPVAPITSSLGSYRWSAFHYVYPNGVFWDPKPVIDCTYLTGMATGSPPAADVEVSRGGAGSYAHDERYCTLRNSQNTPVVVRKLHVGRYAGLACESRQGTVRVLAVVLLGPSYSFSILQNNGDGSPIASIADLTAIARAAVAESGSVTAPPSTSPHATKTCAVAAANPPGSFPAIGHLTVSGGSCDQAVLVTRALQHYNTTAHPGMSPVPTRLAVGGVSFACSYTHREIDGDDAGNRVRCSAGQTRVVFVASA